MEDRRGRGCCEALVAGMPDGTHLTQPEALGTSVRPQSAHCFVEWPCGYHYTSLNLSGCIGELDPRTTTLLRWVVVRTQ